MNVYGPLAITLPASDAEAAQHWWQEQLGLPPAEDGPGLALGEVALLFGPVPQLRLVATEVEDGGRRLVDPAGTVVELVPPDLEAARQAEQTIQEFVQRADDLAGRPVADVVDEVQEVLQGARDRVAALLVGLPHNKVLATQLALGRRAREHGGSEDQWLLHAASTLLSGFVVAGGQQG